MTTFKITIDCDALNPDEYVKLPVILRSIADKIDAGELSIYDDPKLTLCGFDGHVVGKAEFVK